MSTTPTRGLLLVETIVALAVFSLIATAAFGAYRLADYLGDRASKKAEALLLAEEGLEAARAIRDGNFSYLTNGSKGLAIVSNAWQFTGTSDYTDGFQRVLTISTIDTDTRHATSSVSWFERGATTTVEVGTRLTNWEKLAATGAEGLTINTSSACVYTLNPVYLGGITLTYDGSAGAVSITQINAAWVTTTRSLVQIYSPYPTSVWTGTAASGATTTLTTPIAFTGAGSKDILFRWNGSVSGKNFTFRFVFSDGSMKTATINSPILSLCIAL